MCASWCTRECECVSVSGALRPALSDFSSPRHVGTGDFGSAGCAALGSLQDVPGTHSAAAIPTAPRVAQCTTLGTVCRQHLGSASAVTDSREGNDPTDSNPPEAESLPLGSVQRTRQAHNKQRAPEMPTTGGVRHGVLWEPGSRPWEGHVLRVTLLGCSVAGLLLAALPEVNARVAALSQVHAAGGRGSATCLGIAQGCGRRAPLTARVEILVGAAEAHGPRASGRQCLAD